MAQTIHLDIIEGNLGKYGADGWEFTRIAKISGIDVHASGSVYGKQGQVITAVEALIASVGDIGAAHPSTSSSIISEFRPKSASDEVVEIEIIYKPWAAGDSSEVEVGTNVQQTETNKDVNGDLIVLEYTYPDDYVQDSKKAGQTIQQGGMISFQKPTSYKVFTKTESSDPSVKARTYVGTTNLLGWTKDPTAAAKTWMCKGIVGRSQNGGSTYRVTYTFEYREDTWDETSIFINPDDGKPPQDLVDGTGIVTVDNVETLNFNNLNL